MGRDGLGGEAMNVSTGWRTGSRVIFLAICIVFGGLLYHHVGAEQAYVRYSAYPRLIRADELCWIVENRDEDDTIRCEDYGFLQGVIEPAGHAGKPLHIQTAAETVEVPPGEKVCETIPLDLAPGRYTYTLRVAGDHGVNGTCRGKITID